MTLSKIAVSGKSNSPAIDKGTAIGLTGALTTDQRAYARTFDNPGVVNAAGGDVTDIGAYEAAPPATLDVDGSSTATKYDAFTDGVLAIRYMFGLTGGSLTAGALGATPTTRDADAVKAYLDLNRAAFDIDGDGKLDALTDGLLIVRYLFGLRSPAWCKA